MLSEYIATIMIDAATSILFKEYQSEIEAKKGFKITTRVGSGHRTKCSLKGYNGYLKITYQIGKKIIESKQTSYLELAKWRSSSEIVSKHKFFDGNLTVQTSLAHTVLHEFAHLLDIIRNFTYDPNRKRNNVHGAVFISILEELRQKGLDKKVYDQLMLDPLFRSLEIQDTSNIPAKTYSQENVSKGSFYKVIIEDRIGTFKVLNTNRKTVSGILSYDGSEFIQGKIGYALILSELDINEVSITFPSALIQEGSIKKGSLFQVKHDGKFYMGKVTSKRNGTISMLVTNNCENFYKMKVHSALLQPLGEETKHINPHCLSRFN
ncbi:hypothetical protein NI385_28440 (plasmid) [Vibrio parahaemolyticus]|uniref:hypothetical protein n=3 Tax=Vibrio parahaemolyticus TaxID=670 RepID=UPI0023627B07|nr:hypothetical protein [Vibrio parahaemolyticus]MCS0117887.1 hypothetical protein [Vibrio parahaemolyticus]WMN81351.1 hypothetical protein NI385_28440 [Vibrio parahaemolyticus]